MASWGVMDFAGGIVVHATAGNGGIGCCYRGWQAAQFSFLCAATTQPYFDNDRGLYVVGRLVRL